MGSKWESSDGKATRVQQHTRMCVHPVCACAWLRVHDAHRGPAGGAELGRDGRFSHGDFPYVVLGRRWDDERLVCAREPRLVVVVPLQKGDRA